ncbi:protein STABILIZED1 [Cucumis melo var. makuwa]|uniref:Protein STABILIZED1 n=1 Tax=Cucumis melo var. makuwa TaxID=1194695 RepID=A0A5A7UD74_CUCMM|nr:protein STABILIZED1 [Cucumis melo var. makuwa]TYK05121.1 protein STABILIZED1 [Cucumis melo var. makuwa]
MVPCLRCKTKSIDALQKYDHDTHLVAAVAKWFWHYRKVDIARTWLNRAVILASGNPNTVAKWRTISMAEENFHLTTEAILKKLVVALGEHLNFLSMKKMRSTVMIVYLSCAGEVLIWIAQSIDPKEKQNAYEIGQKCVEMGASQERFLECEENEPCDRYVNIGYQGYIR